MDSPESDLEQNIDAIEQSGMAADNDTLRPTPFPEDTSAADRELWEHLYEGGRRLFENDLLRAEKEKLIAEGNVKDLVIANREKELEEERYKRTHDKLTNALNYDGLREELTHRMESGTPFAMVFIDLNKFKAVNDTFGHQAGNDLLVQVASYYQRTEDLFGKFETTRYGGDEFVILIDLSEKPSDIEQRASTVEERARRAERYFENNTVELMRSVPSEYVDHGFGVTHAFVTWEQGMDTTSDQLLEQADKAMLARKPANAR